MTVFFAWSNWRYDNREILMRVRCPSCSDAVEFSGETIVDDQKPLDDTISAVSISGTPTQSLMAMHCPSCGSDFNFFSDAEDAPDISGDPTSVTFTPRLIAHFELMDKLGSGGFGDVFRARDTKLDRIVAVKIPRAERVARDGVESFLRETRAAAQLKHPQIVAVHEVGREGDTLYIVSDFIDGVTLSDWLADQRPSFRDSAELCAVIAEALQHAHDMGVIHRDLKPSNIMLDADNQPHVMDFGLAKRESGEVTVTVSGQVMGTPAFMSPEQAQGDAHNADRRSDVYSMGVMLFEMLTGERPFRGNIRMLLHQILHDEAPSPRKFNATVPRDLETVCLKCLEKDPERRYQSAEELAEDLRRFLAGVPLHARPVSRTERVWRWCKRNRTVATLGSLLIVTLSVVSVAAPLIVKDRAERDQQQVDAAKKEERDRTDRKQQANRLTSLANAAVVSDDVKQAIELFSQVAGLADGHEEMSAVSKTCVSHRDELIQYGRFVQAGASALDALDRRYSAESLQKLRESLTNSKVDRNEIVQVTLRKRIALSLNQPYGILADPAWRDRLKETVLAPPQHAAVITLTSKLLYGLAYLAIAAKVDSDAELAKLGLTALDRLVELEGHSRYEWTLRMWFLGRLGRDSESEQAREHIGKTKPVNARDFYWLGYIALKRGRTQEGERYLRRVVDLEPGLVRPHLDLCSCYRLLKDPLRQIREISVCISLRPNDDFLYTRRGVTYFLADNRDPRNLLDALADFKITVKLNPRSRHAYFYRGRIYVIIKKWKEAAREFTKCVELTATEADSQYWNAVSLAHVGSHQEAAVSAETAVKIGAKSADAHYFAARSYAISVGALRKSKDLSDRETLITSYTGRSMELLQKAVELGFKGFSRLGKGSDFDPVRDDPRFKKLVPTPKSKSKSE